LELRIGLEADFDGVEGVALADVSDCVWQPSRDTVDSPDTQLGNAREDTSDETLPLAAVSCGDDFLAVILVDASRRELRRKLHRHESSEVPSFSTMMVKFITASLE
jgi:hypothetical protein